MRLFLQTHRSAHAHAHAPLKITTVMLYFPNRAHSRGKLWKKEKNENAFYLT